MPDSLVKRFLQLRKKKVTTKEAVKHFGGVKQLADALGIWPQAVYAWGIFPPASKQYELEVKTNGELKANRT